MAAENLHLEESRLENLQEIVEENGCKAFAVTLESVQFWRLAILHGLKLAAIYEGTQVLLESDSLSEVKLVSEERNPHHPLATNIDACRRLVQPYKTASP